jgi:hypothetical protein
MVTVPDPSPPLELGFVAVVLLVAAAIVLLVRRAGGPAGRVAVGLAVYLAAMYALGASGLLGDGLPPRPLILLGPALACTLWFALRSRAGEALAHRAPLALLVGLQAFRLPLELLMHAWSQEGALPVQMTLAGRNFDIVTGITALLVAPFAARSRALVYAWNILGLALLINIVTIAIVSLPGPLRMFPADPPNLLVLRAPYTWLPGFLVQVALAGHILVFRALRRPA